VDNTKELPTVISFCSGYAGIERGLELAGIEHRVIAYVEIEAFAIANLVAKMEAGKLAPAPIWTNLKTFPAHLFRGAADIITGGYPCQPFSAAGKRAGADDPRHLWPFIRQHVQTIKPARCFFENVEGHISLGLSSVISDLEEDSYRATWGIFSAEEVGAPHRRKRVFIMGDSEYDGLLASEKRGSDLEDGYRAKERQIEAVELKGAGQPNCGANLSASNEVADTGSKGLQGGEGGGGTSKKGQSDRHSTTGSEELPNAVGTRSEAGLSRQKRSNKEGHAGKLNYSCSQQCRGKNSVQWSVEPGLGRVVDGCANRVDRIRLLGNGVVPQTAAKAWQVLDARFL
jgi:DNA (cytosine-5)-methyltransferase 1